MPDRCLAERFAAVQKTLKLIDQDHVLRFYDRLEDPARERLLSQIETIDWSEIGRLIETHVNETPESGLPDVIEPAPFYPRRPTEALAAKYMEARTHGESLIRAGKVAVFTVAGGQGTRLGWDGPKGMFRATPLRRVSLFECLAEYIGKVQRKYDTTVPWYVMTSPANDSATREYFARHDFLGLDPETVMIFPQGMMPAVDLATSRILLADRDQLAVSPNGHGGSLRALSKSGAVDDMIRRGVEQISYTQVDNPVVRVVDPLFLGLHAVDDCDMSSKALAKTDPYEKVGVFASIDGKVTVIEYSDLPMDLAEARDENDRLRFGAGSIAIHAIRVDFVQRLNRSQVAGLPFHRAEKKVSFVDTETGKYVSPEAPNAVKFEMFVFDALPLCTRSMVYETDRIEEFAPIKNADAPVIDESVDSPATSQRIQIERAARWLEARGVDVPRDGQGRVDAKIEISALTAVDPEDLIGVQLPPSIKKGEELLL